MVSEGKENKEEVVSMPSKSTKNQMSAEALEARYQEHLKRVGEGQVGRTRKGGKK